MDLNYQQVMELMSQAAVDLHQATMNDYSQCKACGTDWSRNHRESCPYGKTIARLGGVPGLQEALPEPLPSLMTTPSRAQTGVSELNDLYRSLYAGPVLPK